MNTPIKIALVEDQALFRKGIASILQQEKAFEIILEAENGHELLTYLKKKNSSPNIILMDLNMPVLNGVETTRTLVQDFPEIKIIALTSYTTKAFIANMIHMGAASYVVKNASSQELITTLKEVALKGFYYTDQIMEVLRNNASLLKKNRQLFCDEKLTKREIQVLKLVCQQYSTKEIAQKLFINYRTVEGHRNNLLQKTGSKNTAGLVIYAVLNDLISASEMI